MERHIEWTMDSYNEAAELITRVMQFTTRAAKDFNVVEKLRQYVSQSTIDNYSTREIIRVIYARDLKHCLEEITKFDSYTSTALPVMMLYAYSRDNYKEPGYGEQFPFIIQNSLINMLTLEPAIEFKRTVNSPVIFQLLTSAGVYDWAKECEEFEAELVGYIAKYEPSSISNVIKRIEVIKALIQEVIPLIPYSKQHIQDMRRGGKVGW